MSSSWPNGRDETAGGRAQHLWLPALIAIVAGFATYAFGAPLLRAVGVALTLGIVAYLLARSLAVGQPGWPEPPDNAGRERIRAQWTVPVLDAALARPRYSGDRLLDKIREVAEPVLARRGEDLSGPLAQQWFSPSGVRLLRRESGPPTADDLRALIDALARLAAEDTPGRPGLKVPPSLISGRRHGPSMRSLLADRRRRPHQAADPPADPPTDPIGNR